MTDSYDLPIGAHFAFYLFADTHLIVDISPTYSSKKTSFLSPEG